MRFKLFFFTFIIIGILIFLQTRNSNSNQLQLSVEPTDTITITPKPQEKLTGIQSSWFVVHDISKLKLHSNLIDKLSAADFKEQNSCESLVNGGFFSEKNEHIGLFIEDGKTIQKEQTNSLFNGYFSALTRTASISKDRPTGPRFALQTGPILIKDDQVYTLKLMRDEKARRMVAAITEDGNVIFLTFYEASSLAQGPKLVDLPQLVEKLSDENALKIVDAINLDGGNHSAFISNEVQLTDIQTPGSYFCVRN
jgi:uncharacterized protein YigE (DUF2233 family)